MSERSKPNMSKSKHNHRNDRRKSDRSNSSFKKPEDSVKEIVLSKSGEFLTSNLSADAQEFCPGNTNFNKQYEQAPVVEEKQNIPPETRGSRFDKSSKKQSSRKKSNDEVVKKDASVEKVPESWEEEEIGEPKVEKNASSSVDKFANQDKKLHKSQKKRVKTDPSSVKVDGPPQVDQKSLINLQDNQLQSTASSFDETKDFRNWDKTKDLLSEKEIDIDSNLMEEKQGDLFQIGETSSLAHCVAEDMNMGSGVALTFREQFKGVDELLNQRKVTGEVAYLQRDDRYLYYLITKERSSDKPTNRTLYQSLENLKDLMIKHRVKHIVIPQIGCGLDRLEWKHVKSMIAYIFENSGIKFTVCFYDKAYDVMSSKKFDHGSRKCKVTDQESSIRLAPQYSIIIYLDSEDKHQDKEYNIIKDAFTIVRRDPQGGGGASPKLGTINKGFTRNDNYCVCACTVRKNYREPVDYVAFDKCIREINKYNKACYKKGEAYTHVAIQQYRPPSDRLLMSKLVNLMRNTLYGVDILLYKA